MQQTAPMPPRLAGKVALVTGGSSGIGRGIALALAREGCAVAVSYATNAAGGSAVVRAIEKAGGRAASFRGDVSVRREVEGLIDATTDLFGRLDVLVNSAGVAIRAGIWELTEEMWDRVLDVNLKGVFLCCQAAARRMVDQGDGRILNIASIRGIAGSDRSMHYAAAKAGVIALTKSLARELAPTIRVNAIAPGYVDTRLQRELTAEARHRIEEATPLHRFGDPRDLGSAAVFLVSDDAAFITGQTLVVDGGYLRC